MHEKSKVWIYASDREFTDEEARSMSSRIEKFIQNWTSHSQQVTAGFEIRYNRFLILLLDESHVAAGGCSIDSSVHFIKSLEKDYQITITDRMKFAFRQGDRIDQVSKSEFEKLLSEGIITDDTVVFNNLVASKQELDTNWEIPFSKSWHKNFFGSNVN